MEISRFKFSALYIVIAFILYPISLNAQDKLDNRLDVENHFEEVNKNPDNFSSDERIQIYLHEVSKQISVNLDSAQVGYNKMLEFGNKIKDSLMVGRAYSSMASVERFRGDFKRNLYYRKKAEKYLKPNSRFLSSSYTESGIAYISLNKIDSAEIFIDKAFKIAFETKDSVSYSNIWITKAQLYTKQRRFSSAIESYQEALKFAHLAPSGLLELSCYNHISLIYLKIDDVNNSNLYLNKGLEIAKSKGYKSTVNKFMLQKGSHHMKLGKYQEAYDLYSEVLAKFPKDKISNTTFRIHYLSTQAALKLNDQGLADQHHKKMEEHFSKDYTQGENPYNLTNSLYYQSKNNLKKVTFYTTQLLNSHHRTDVLKAYQILTQINRNNGKLGKALMYQDSVIKISKNLSILSQQNIIYDFESKYQKTLQDKEILALTADQEIQNIKINRQSQMLLFSLLGLILAALAGLGFLYAYRTKAKSNLLLKNKNSQLKAALEDNKMLIKEIHHRVKNNLQVVSSLLNLQSRFEKDTTIVKAINTGKYRVQSMSLLHQNLYVNEDLKSIHIKKYFEDLANTLVTEYPLNNTKINLHLDIEDLEMDIDTVVPLGLIGNELITNVLKYAFKNKATGNLHFSISEIMGKIRMKVIDDGVGIPFTEFPLKNTSMGFQLIQSFARKIKANVKIDNTNGTSIVLTFVAKEKPQNLKAKSNVAS